MASFSDITLEPGVAQGLRRGERRSQAAAYHTLAPTVMGMSMRILQDEQLAQEVVQDTFVELIEHAHTLKDPEAAVAWVRKIAVNHCLMKLRSPWIRKRRLVSHPDQADGTQASARQGDLRDLERALARLSADSRMVLWLHEVEGYTHGEIGALMGKSPSYSKSQLARGYKKLNAQLNDATFEHDTAQVEDRVKDNIGKANEEPVGSAHVRPAFTS